MTRIKGQLTTSDYLPIEEFNRLCDCLRKDKLYTWELYCRVAFCTALRISDLLTLRWIDVLDTDELIKIEHKTKKTRSIPLAPSVSAKFQELYVLMGKPEKNMPLIYNHRRKRIYSLEHINDKLKDFKREYRLSIKHFSTHSFRKTFGRFVYEQCGKSAESLLFLNEILVHESVRTTKRYIGLNKDEINSIYQHIKF